MNLANTKEYKKALEINKQLAKIKSNINKLILDNEEVFDELNSLSETYNTLLSSAKSAVKEIESTEAFEVGFFRRDKLGAEKLEYAPGKLPAHILLMPGVATAVSTEKINELVAMGAVTTAVLSDAAVIVKPKAPGVRGPKEIVLDLS